MAAARVLLLLAGRPVSPSFVQSVCRLLGAGPGLGPWPTHCSLKRGRLVLSDGPFPGASTRLPLQRPPFCPFVALDQQQLRTPGAELPTNRGVDLGVAVMLQSSDQTVLLTRRTRTLSISPNLWVPPGGHVELDEEVTSLLTQPSPCPETRDLCLGLPWVCAEGGTKDLGPVSLIERNVWDLCSLVPSCWTEGFESFGRRVDSSCPRASSLGSLWGYGSTAELEEDGRARPLALPMSTLLRTTPTTAEGKERVSSGTKFALRLWLQHVRR
ncbi:nucleoside diphosphate-linked moiety X motif 17 isoform X2 [Callorhinus ursinus]|uniref:nucleoside diphosphate-linked moiety X motif 17 isoform X2 n=1 Tax=Callorhinus ursinus TaxID=34884 RepID=UPI003CD0463B